MLELLYKNIRENGSDMVCCGYNRINEKTKKEYSREMINFPVKYMNIPADIEWLPFICASLCNKLIKYECVKNVRYPIIKIGEDASFLIDLYLNINKITFINDILFHYNVKDVSLMSTTPQAGIKKFAQVLHDIYIKHETNKDYQQIIILMVFIHIGISMCVRAYQNKNINTRDHIRWTKRYLDENYPGWTKSKHLKYKSLKKLKFKGFALVVCKKLYQLRLFRLFLFPYNFLIKTIGKDIKW